MMGSPPDDQLMLDVRDGDLQKLGVLFERYQTPLFNFFLKMTGSRQASEDQVQEVFFRILRFRHTFRDGASFVTWMYRIARNLGIDRIRAGRREVALERDMDHPSLQPSADERLGAQQEALLLRRALARLPRDRRELLVLSRFENLKYDQIAQIIGCRTEVVRGRVFRALRELREIYVEMSGGLAAAG